MNPCPVCATEIAESFGLIECPKCHSMLFVDFDGNLKVQIADDEVVPSVTETKAWDIPVPEEATVVEDETFQEIQSFVSSPVSEMREGTFFYDVKILNLDTQDLKDEVLDILKDKKLGIDLKKLNFKLSHLVIEDLNAVKASVLVTKLKHLPIDIEWTQKSLIQDSPEGKNT
jgi:hypothetical protein